MSVRAGDYHVGIRTNSEAVQAHLQSAFRPHLVDDPAAPPNLTVLEQGTQLSGSRPVYRIYEGCAAVFSTPRIERAVAMVGGSLEVFLPSLASPPSILRLEALALIGARGAVIAPWWLRYRDPAMERRLRRDGVRLFEQVPIRVDSEAVVLLAAPPRMMDASTASPIQARSVVETEPTWPTRIPLRGWIFGLNATGDRPSRAEATALGMAIAHRPHGAAANLSPLASVTRGLNCRALTDPARLRSELRSLLEDG